MAEVSRQLQDGCLSKESDEASISKQTRIRQIQVDIVEVIEERSQEARLVMAPLSGADKSWVRQY